MFQILHEFWVNQCPFFNDFYAMYYVLDLLTILIFFRLLFSLADLMFIGGRK